MGRCGCTVKLVINDNSQNTVGVSGGRDDEAEWLVAASTVITERSAVNKHTAVE